MKQIITLFIAIIFLTGLENCKISTDTGFTPGQSTQQFKASATVTIRYYEYNVVSGQDEFIEEKQYFFDCSVFVNPPLTLNGVSESNAFGLAIYPDRSGNTGEEGNIVISSCIIVDDMTAGKVLLQYRTYSLNGDQLSGTLTDNHIAEAAAANIIWAWDVVGGISMTMPFYMANGTKMTGSLTANSISLDISGQSTDTYRRFSCHLTGVPQ